MKKQFQILAVVAVLLLAVGTVLAQKATRIRFARGATSAVVSGHLENWCDKKVFVIRVLPGQTLRTEQDKSDSSLNYITVYIKNPAGEGVGDSDASCNNRREISPTVAGDYTIEVVECRKADPWKGNFKLKVSVQ